METNVYLCPSCGVLKTPTIKQSWDHLGKTLSALGDAFKAGQEIPPQSALAQLEMTCQECQTTMIPVKPEDRLAIRSAEPARTPPELATMPFRQHNGDEGPEPDVACRHLTIIQWRCAGCHALLQTTERNQRVTCPCGKLYSVHGPWRYFFGDPITVHEEETKRDE